MEALPLNNTPLSSKHSSITKRKTHNKIPTAKEYPEAFALFSGIYQSDQFTIDNVHRAFSEVLRKKQTD